MTSNLGFDVSGLAVASVSCAECDRPNVFFILSCLQEESASVLMLFLRKPSFLLLAFFIFKEVWLVLADGLPASDD